MSRVVGAPDSPVASAAYERLVPSGEHLDVTTGDGAVLAVTVAGPSGGPTAVLPHCWTGGREVWAPVANRLAAGGWRVVLYDQRGHGSSTLGADGCTIERLGRDLRDVLLAVDARDAVLAGHSMGGMTIQSFVAQHGDVAAERVAGVALVATTSGGLGRGRLLDGVTARVIASPRLERAMQARYGHRLVRGALGRHPQRADMELTRDLFVACPADVRLGFLRAMQRMDLRHSLIGLSAPVTVLVGTADRLTPPKHARAMEAAWPGATLQVLTGRGHMLPLEATTEVVLAIRTVVPARS